MSAMSQASTAGWVISVCSSCSSSLRDRGRVAGVDEDVIGQRLAEQRRHDLVGLGERLRHDGLGVTELVEHVDVLRALPGVEERDLGRGAVAEEDARGPGASCTARGFHRSAPARPGRPCRPARRARRSRWRPGPARAPARGPAARWAAPGQRPRGQRSAPAGRPRLARCRRLPRARRAAAP